MGATLVTMSRLARANIRGLEGALENNLVSIILPAKIQ
jgi:hypothetical protein